MGAIEFPENTLGSFFGFPTLNFTSNPSRMDVNKFERAVGERVAIWVEGHEGRSAFCENAISAAGRDKSERCHGIYRNFMSFNLGCCVMNCEV
jgi:hypothetical protein